jgi:hypothetical protein
MNFDLFPGLRNRTQGILQVQLLLRVIAITLDLALAKGNLLVSDLELLAYSGFPIGHFNTSLKEIPN